MWTVIKHNSNAIVTITTRCKVTALDFYDKEARTLMQDESLEVWDNGKLVSRCQYEECNNAGSRYMWKPMETAPRDGTPIQAKIPGHGSDNIIQWMRIDDYWTWGMVEDQEWPDSWDDGLCWASNSSGQPSVLPVAWRPIA